MPRDVEITDQLLNALAMVESQNNPQAVGDRGLRYPAYGAYQMRQPAFEDVRRLRPQDASGIEQLSSILGQPDRQRQLARAYLGILDQNYGLDSLEDILAAYNAGIGTVRKKRVPSATHDYVQRILQLLNQP